VALVVILWIWQQVTLPPLGRLWIAGAALAVLVGSGLAGLDPAAAVAEASLLAGACALAWLASRDVPPPQWPAILGLVLSGLSVWGILQVTAGPEHAEAVLAQIPEHLRVAAAERLGAGRAFASQPLPSHLAVLLATALPLLLAQVKWSWRAVVWMVGALLCVVGLAATRSPIGVGLALASCLALAIARGRRRVLVPVLVLAAVLLLVVLGRGDVLELEPVKLRVDNWQTAVWIWSTSPAHGVGFGGFGQAVQTAPLHVGNRPRHAHSLPMEWLAEFGPVGFLMTLIAGLALLWLLKGLWPKRPDLAVALAVVPAHNLADFSFFSSGVVVPWAVLLGWGIAICAGERRAESGAWGRLLVVAAAALVLAFTTLHATSVTVGGGVGLAPEERFANAVRARELAPWRAEPLVAIAVGALESGDAELIARAARELDQARWLRPRSASVADLRGLLAEKRGEGPTAVSEAWTAAHDNPSDPTFSARFEGRVERLSGGR
jgi:hypothetical protein